MARIRQLKIGFFQNEELAALPPHDRLLFAGLWLLADREGRLDDRPKRLQAQLFPYEDIDIDAALGRLADGGFVDRYVVATARYLQIVNFSKHQHLHPNEQKSLIPQRDTSQNADSEHHVSQVKPGNVQSNSGLDRKFTSGITCTCTSTSGEDLGGEIGDRDRYNAVPHAGVDRARARPNGASPPLHASPSRPPRTPPLVGNHLRCHPSLACGRGLCVPQTLGTQWSLQLSRGDPHAAFAELKAWIDGVLDETPDGPVGDDLFDFWRHKWATTHGRMTSKPVDSTVSRNIAAAERTMAWLRTQGES